MRKKKLVSIPDRDSALLQPFPFFKGSLVNARFQSLIGIQHYCNSPNQQVSDQYPILQFQSLIGIQHYCNPRNCRHKIKTQVSIPDRDSALLQQFLLSEVDPSHLVSIPDRDSALLQPVGNPLVT